MKKILYLISDYACFHLVTKSPEQEMCIDAAKSIAEHDGYVVVPLDCSRARQNFLRCLVSIGMLAKVLGDLNTKPILRIKSI